MTMSSVVMLNSPAGARTLTPLPPVIHRGLSAVTAFGLLSLISTAILFAHLLYRLVTWKHREYGRVNQYVALLLNLIFADFQQALGFVLNLQWLRDNGIFALTSTCWTQAWFLNAGDVSSGLFTLAMACHLFADIVFDYRLPYIPFVISIVGLWAFNYILATIGVIQHPQDFYMRAGMWCWINEKYMPERLWFHYIWILITEFCIVVLYTLMFVVLWRRIRGFFYVSSENQLRAESAARTVIAYPIIYVVCTLPAVVARLRIMTGHKAGFEEFTFVGVMMTSNGWLDVLLYVFTRRSLIFGPAIQNQEAHGLDTFQPWTQYQAEQQFDQLTDLSLGPSAIGSISKTPEMQHNSGRRSRNDSPEALLRLSRYDFSDAALNTKKSPNVVEEEVYEEPRLPPPHVVHVARSEGDLRRPALRFPRRRDPMHNVRNASADVEKDVEKQMMYDNTDVEFHAITTSEIDKETGASADVLMQDSVNPETDMEISTCTSMSSNGSRHLPRSPGHT